MTYKQIEASREVRLWIGQVIVPAVSCGLLVYSNPQVRDFVNRKKDEVKQKFQRKERA